MLVPVTDRLSSGTADVTLNTEMIGEIKGPSKGLFYTVIMTFRFQASGELARHMIDNADYEKLMWGSQSSRPPWPAADQYP